MTLTQIIDKEKKHKDKIFANSVFANTMKLSELIDINYNLLTIIDRIGLGFAFGDLNIEEACKRAGINANTFLLICNIYTFSGYQPSVHNLQKAEIKDIVKYLHQSHAYYISVAVKTIEDSMQEMMNNCEERYKSIIWKFFREYKEELRKHFEYEEAVVFPYVSNVINHNGAENYTIMEYEENHTNIEEKLNDLKNIIMKYMPQQCSNRDISNVLLNLYRLEEDLAKHTEIEENILIPVVNRLEEDIQSKN